VELSLHRGLDTKAQPLHVSRSCTPRAAAGAAAAAAAAGAAGAGSTPPGDAAAFTQHAKGASVTRDDSASSSSGVTIVQAQQPPPRVSGVGSLNVLWFEVTMLLVLAGSLPAVYLQKRRHVRL
jgi:hypothetical protein